MNFDALDAPAALKRALQAKGYATATAVQAAVLEPTLRGRDMMVSAQTGSGKTVAFGLVLAPILLGEKETLGAAGKPMGLVVAPTRELAQQVARELAWLYGPAGGKVVCCVGGTDARAEARQLAHGAHLVVGTPGRLCDHLDRKQLNLTELRALVLDEADEMLDLGFRDELERIQRDAPPSRRSLLFSATLPAPIEELARKNMHNPARVVATPLSQAHADIAYVAHLVSQREREHAVVNTLRAFDEVKALVFCETRMGVSRLHASLVERGFQAAALSGELSQPERARALASLRDGRARVLVATDVAARGIDLPDIGLVVHADLPHDAEVMQHRSGRTGRAGRKGVSVLLVPVASRVFAQRLLSKARVTADWAPVPTAEVIRTQEKERLFQELLEESKAVDSDELDVARRLLVERTPEQLVSALVRATRSKRPSPEELPETEQAVLRALKRPAPRPVSATPEDGIRRAPGAHPSAGHGSGHDGAARPTRPARPVPEVAATGAPTAEGVWFHLNVGRSQKADPKWLVPLLCKRGGVTKAELGRIVILAEETRFAVVAHAAVKYAALSKRPDPREPGIRIRLLRPAEETAETAKRPRPDRPGRA